MKKFIFAAIVALISMTGARAENYMFGAVSYENTHFGFKSTDPQDNYGMGLNGFGLQYTYGFGITDRPMNVEVGLNWNMVFGSKNIQDIPQNGVGFDTKLHQNLMRLNIPVSYIYHFNAMGNFGIAPYAGLDLRFNLVSKMSEKTTVYNNGLYVDENKESISYFSKSDMQGHPARRFQLGWHIGVRFEYQMKYFLSLQYGTDFIRFYNFSYGDYNEHINTGNFALSLGYYFK